MNIEKSLKNIIADILDINPLDIDDDTYLIRDLNMESIDLLELGVALNTTFKIDVDEDVAFLKDLRFNLDKLSLDNPSREKALSKIYTHLSQKRIHEILKDLDNGPVLKFKDVLDYVRFKKSSL
ncbi:phosphopantetheine-binding protein [Desulfothermus okinawensis JCM 13304]